MADHIDLTNTASSLPPHPKGTMPILCVDVIDMGEKLDTWEGKTKIKRYCKYAFVSGKRRDDGQPFVLYSENFSLPGMAPNANHRKFLEQWRGEDFTEAELPNRDTGNPGPDVSKLVGVMGLGTISHKPRKPVGVYTNLVSVIPAMEGYTPSPELLACAKQYVRGDWVAEVRARNAAAIQAWRDQNVAEGRPVMGPPKALTDALDLEPVTPDNLPF